MSAPENHERIILLTRLLSRSISRAPQEFRDAPSVPGTEIFNLIERQFKAGVCVEYFQPDDVDEDDDAKRLTANRGKDFIRVTDIEKNKVGSTTYYTVLFEFVDASIRSFPVVDVSKFEGRELQGSEDERGATAAHLMVRLPDDGDYDECNYRCVLESAPNVTRQAIEFMIKRMLRRIAHAEGWVYIVRRTGKNGKAEEKTFRYWPKVDLVVDVGRSVGNMTSDDHLQRFVFTKRSEKQNIADKTDVIHEDVTADVEYRIKASQGPKDRNKFKTWANELIDHYKKLGFTSKLYFKRVGGREYSGSLNATIDGATDLFMCQREIVTLGGEPKKWVSKIQPEIRDAMRLLLDRDGLWERASR